MLYALGYPFSFAVLLAAFVLGLLARGWVQRLISGARRPKWVRANTRRPHSTWLKLFIDPYGLVAALFGGVGWGVPVETSDPRRRSRARQVVELVAGPLVLAGLGIGILVAFRAWSGLHVTGFSLKGAVLGSAFHRGNSHVRYGLPFGQVALFLAGVELVAMGVLALVPLPPMDGGRLLFLLLPRSSGWNKVRYRLEDENWGLLILIFLSFLAVFGNQIVLSALSHAVDPIVSAVT